MANRYVVTTDRLFIDDTTSVGRGLFDADEIGADVAKLDKLCEKHPRDIRKATKEETETGSRSSRVERNNKPIQTNEDEAPAPKQEPVKEAKAPEAPKAPQAPQPDADETEAPAPKAKTAPKK